MVLPDKLLIRRIEDYHTHYLWQSTDGKLFWGYLTFAFEKPVSEIKENWKKYRCEYAVFHTFDKDGNYLKTKYFFGGTTDVCDNDELENHLKKWVTELGGVKYGDIKIKLFQIVIDGFVFGLVPNKELESIDLQPSSTISFHKPWDGEYYT